ncbi:NAD(P)/FAD-dependent oxidoreductase [Arenicella xantha]|uniref:Flavin-dependent dehydrogenase n=1 Tax=Arenicella xantha TaxID=644221 RepID=A0A395JNB5_9GAMM|nr:NAD(P)/FAD-dependent oxidoreductase [Arenicella xantha]RBP52967.1 flavin-dependent dehydrogenase [Arenicella xantha]
MKKTFDVIVVGGGPAGSTVSTYLSRAGFKVLVLERDVFPRFHIGETLLPYCYHLFEDLGVLKQMERDFSRKPGVTFSSEDNSSHSNWCFAHLIRDESSLSFHVERSRFDDMLLKNSVKEGVVVCQNTRVVSSSIDQETQKVWVKTQDGDSYEARFLIDASGQDCFLGNTQKSKKPNRKLSPRIAVSCQWGNANLDATLRKGGLRIIHLEGEKKGWLWMIPVAEGKLSVGVVTESSYFLARKKQLAEFGQEWCAEFYRQEIFTTTLGKQILDEANTLNEIQTNGDYSYTNTDKYGEHYAAIGDASAFLDPMFASGVYLAMKSAELLAQALVKKLNHDDKSALKEAYSTIDGAYTLIEKMINIYYNPDAVRFSDAQQALTFDDQEGAYAMIHFLLAGDFFANQEKYNRALEILNSKKKIEGFFQLIDQKEISRGALCE